MLEFAVILMVIIGVALATQLDVAPKAAAPTESAAGAAKAGAPGTQ